MRHLRLLVPGAGALALMAMLVAPSELMAAATASGSFSITSFSLSNFTYSGFIDLDAGTPLGDAISGAGGQDLAISGSVIDPSAGPPPNASFDVTATATDFSFTAEGSGACTTALCVNGPVTLAGEFTALDDRDPALLPADSVHVFDGTIGLTLGGTGAGGTFCLNSYALLPTPTGTDQKVSSADTFCDSTKDGATSAFDASITFDEVTAPGETRFAGISDLPAGLPETITLNPAFSVFIDIFTTATTTGGATVCVKYADDNPADGFVDGTNVSEEVLTLLHGEQVTFSELTTITVDTAANEVCGHTESLSPFVLAAGAPLETTTTSSTSTSTITTTSTSSTTTSTAPELLSGKKLLLTEKAGKPQKRKLLLISKDGSFTLGDGNGSADDPTSNGGSLRLTSNASAGGAFLIDATYDLPASGWKLIGKADENKGYKWKGSSAVKSMIVKPGKLLKIVGKGGDVGLSGTNPNPVNVVLTLGAQKYCLTFGGSVSFKEEKKYTATNASTGTCPASPSGAFLD